MDFPFQIPLPVALAIIAVLGYIAGRRSRVHALAEADKARRELRRAKVVARELEQIAEGVRKNLASHHLSVAKFKDRVAISAIKKRRPPGRTCAARPSRSSSPRSAWPNKSRWPTTKSASRPTSS